MTRQEIKIMKPTIAQQHNIERANAETGGDLALSFLLSIVILGCLMPSWWRKQSRKREAMRDAMLRAEGNQEATAQRVREIRRAA